MAHFYANIQGNRGEATRMGSKDSGMDGHVRGWDVGGNVIMRHNSEKDQDECTIYLTKGSGYGGPSSVCLGTFTAKDLKRLAKRNDKRAARESAKRQAEYEKTHCKDCYRLFEDCECAETAKV